MVPNRIRFCCVMMETPGQVGFEPCFEEKGRRVDSKDEISRYSHGDSSVSVLAASQVVRLEKTFCIFFFFFLRNEGLWTSGMLKRIHRVT